MMVINRKVITIENHTFSFVQCNRLGVRSETCAEPVRPVGGLALTAQAEGALLPTHGRRRPQGGQR